MKPFTPFTYYIRWSKYNYHYYGVRYAKSAHPDELWSTYFTSSKIVKNLRGSLGDPDIVEIRKTFKSKEEAILWEHKVLRRLNVNANPIWLNATYSPAVNSSVPWNKGLKGLKTNYPKTRKSRGALSEEHKQKLRDAAKKQWEEKTQEEIDLIKETMSKNKKIKTPWNKGRKGKQVAWNKGKEMDSWTCEHCGKVGRGPATYSRWHGDNCKQK